LAVFGLDSARREKWWTLYRDFALFFEFRGDLGTVRNLETRGGRLSRFHNFWSSGCGDIGQIRCEMVGLGTFEGIWPPILMV
jgi:hypothetical protein